MSVFALILEQCPVSLWGLTSRQRLQRVLERAGITEIVEDLAAVPAQSSVLLLRADYLYDDRVLNTLAKMSNTVLEVAGAKTHVAVAAHVSSKIAPQVKDVLSGTPTSKTLPALRAETPETLTSAYQQNLRKLAPPFVLPITGANRRDLERLLFSSSYKGVTDLVTKWAWPRPARWAVRQCVRFGLRPNHVTMASLILVVLAGTVFSYGIYGWGLLAGWLMTFLDTVDGKLARVTVTSSRFGHIFDHAIDLIHPPFWYVAWGLGLGVAHLGAEWLSLSVTLWLIVSGYVVGRLVEGTFRLWLGTFGIFCWRPTDSYFRLITARRNPNLILLTVGAASGRPDLGLLAVACWTVLTSLFLLARLTMAGRERIISGPLRSWFEGVDQENDDRSLAVRLFTRRPGGSQAANKATSSFLKIVPHGQMLRIGMLSNPLSGGNRKGLEAIRKVLTGHPQVIHREVQTPANVASALADFAREEVDIVAVNGGDGTIQAVLTALFHRSPLEALPLLAVFRSGTTSLIAGDVGLQGSRDSALQRLIAWARTGDGDAVILKRPVLRVQVPDQEPLCGMFFGAAGICQGIRFFHNKIHGLGLRGQLAPGLVIARFLLAVARRNSEYVVQVPITIAVNEDPPEQRDCLLVLVTTLERLFFGLRPYWGTENGPLHYTAVFGRPRHLLRALPYLLRGRKCRFGTPEHGYFSHNVNELRLSLDSSFALDGELYTPDSRLGPVVVKNAGPVSFLRL